MNKFQQKKASKMNIISKKWTLFYPFIHFSPNKQKDINMTEKQKINVFGIYLLKLKTINARTLLKSFQPIHSLIIILIILFKFQ